ncbi:MAG: MerC domain-containing protein [Sphingobium sp.]|nr:MerC domain-containing protein [Sphingobium sp.]
MLNNRRNGASLDHMAIGLSALCAVHCLLTVVILSALTSLGHFFTSPIIHEVGLVLAILVGAAALGRGVLRHRLLLPAFIGICGLGLMGFAITMGHGLGEGVVTLCGVALVALAHYLNMRAECACTC